MGLDSVVLRHMISTGNFDPSLYSLVLGHKYVISQDSMKGSQLMGLDSMGIDIYNIHGYLYELTVGQ